MSHEKKLVLIGAGNIGKGYLADLFSARGYHLVFLTHRREQAESMRKEGRYPFYKISNDGRTEEYFISGYEAYSTAAEREACVEALCNTDYASVHLYPKSYPDIAALLAETVKRKLQMRSERTLDVLLCVNSMRPAKVFRKYILEHLQTPEQKDYFEAHIGLVEALTNRGGYQPTEEFLQQHKNAVIVSGSEDLPVDGAAFRGEFPEDAPLKTMDHFEVRLINKLWSGNMRHASIALYAYHQGETLLWKGAQSAYARMCIEQASEEAIFAVTQEFGISREALEEGDRYANLQEYWEVMAKKQDNDSALRVAAGPIRKLAKDERLVGPALACICHGKLPYFLAKSVALMYSFRNPRDEEAVELGAYIDAHGLPAAMEHFSGLSDRVPEEKLLRQLVLAHTADFGTARDF